MTAGVVSRSLRLRGTIVRWFVFSFVSAVLFSRAVVLSGAHHITALLRRPKAQIIIIIISCCLIFSSCLSIGNTYYVIVRVLFMSHFVDHFPLPSPGRLQRLPGRRRVLGGHGSASRRRREVSGTAVIWHRRLTHVNPRRGSRTTPELRTDSSWTSGMLVTTGRLDTVFAGEWLLLLLLLSSVPGSTRLQW